MFDEIFKRYQRVTRKWVSNGGIKRKVFSTVVTPERMTAIDLLVARFNRHLRDSKGYEAKDFANRQFFVNDALDKYPPLKAIEKELSKQKNHRKKDQS